MWERIRSNTRRSLVLVAVMGVLLITLGYYFGELFVNNPYTGLVIAFIIWVMQALIPYYKGDKILLAVARAREASNAVWNVQNYEAIACECGAKLRVPLKFKSVNITCLRYRRRHIVRRKR